MDEKRKINFPLLIAMLVIIGSKLTGAQDMTTTTTAATMTSQNISSHPHQVMNLHFAIPGGKLLGALKLGALKLLALKKLSQGHGEEDNSFFGRCLGAARRLKFVMPLIIFKLGVIVTTLAFLSLFAMKGLTIGIVLLVMNAVGFLGKAALFKHHLYGGGGKSDAAGPSPSSPTVHLHVHKDPEGGYDWGGMTATKHGHDFGPTAWSERVQKGLTESHSLAEKMELINLYKRLGFNVNNALRNEASGGYIVYPDENGIDETSRAR